MSEIKKIDQDGNVFWLDSDGRHHRENGPAIIWANGQKEWAVNGQRHRENGPAVETLSGDRHWFVNGRLHREDGPAMEYANGSFGWYKQGNLHREDGPALVSMNKEGKILQAIYFLNGEAGPKVEQQVKENIARLEAEKQKQEILKSLMGDSFIEQKTNFGLARPPKKI